MSNSQGGNQRGFTLLELMIVVVVIAILTAIALPNYTKYVQRTRRSDGQSALLNAQQAEEKFFYRCNRYGSMGEIYGTAAPTCGDPFVAGTAVDSPQKYYSVAISNIPVAPAIGYTLSATPQNAQANDPCKVLSVDNTGLRKATGDANLSTDGDSLRCWH
jgi:type IV pilus assembly protein PilE